MLRKLSVLILIALVLPVAVLAQTTGKIAGQVTDAKTGGAMPGASVVVVDTELGAATDIDGNYYIVGLPAGTYTIQVQFIGFQTQTVVGIEVSPDHTRELNIELTPDKAVLAQTTGKIAGQVTDAKTGRAMPGAAVVVVDTTLGTATNIDGSYYLLGLPAGTYTIQAQFIGFQTQTVVGIEVSPDYTRELNFELTPDTAVLAQTTGKIAGQVTDAETGGAMSGASVVVVDTELGAATDIDGNYYIVGLTAGTYTILVQFIGFQTQTVVGVEVSPDHTRELNIELTPDR